MFVGHYKDVNTRSLNTREYKTDEHPGNKLVYNLKPAGRVQADLV